MGIGHNHDSTDQECYRVMLIGDGAVGKSSIMLRYCENEFDARHMMTIGVDFKTKIIELKNGDKIRLQIWDTAGQERFRNITPVYFRSSHGVALVFDVSNVESFEKSHGCSEKPKVLIGNKIDLLRRKVSKRRGEALAAKHQIMYFETSALDNIGIDEVFLTLATLIRKKLGHYQEQQTTNGEKPFQLTDSMGDTMSDLQHSADSCCTKLWRATESYYRPASSNSKDEATPTTMASFNEPPSAIGSSHVMAAPALSNAKQPFTRVSTSGRVLSGTLSRKTPTTVIDH